MQKEDMPREVEIQISLTAVRKCLIPAKRILEEIKSNYKN